MPKLIANTKYITKIIDKRKNNANKPIYKVRWTDSTESWEKVDDLIDIYDELVKFELHRDKKKAEKWVEVREDEPHKIYKMVEQGHPQHQINSKRKKKKNKKTEDYEIIQNNEKEKQQAQRQIIIEKAGISSISAKQKSNEQGLGSVILKEKNQKGQKTKQKDCINQIISSQVSHHKQKEGIHQHGQTLQKDQDFVGYTLKQRQIVQKQFRKLMESQKIHLSPKNDHPHINYSDLDAKPRGQHTHSILSKIPGENIDHSITPGVIHKQTFNAQSIRNYLNKINNSQVEEQSDQTPSATVDLLKKSNFDKTQNNVIAISELDYSELPRKNEEGELRDKAYYDKKIKQIIKIQKRQNKFMFQVEFETIGTSEANHKRMIQWVNRGDLRRIQPQLLLEFYEQLYLTIMNSRFKQKPQLTQESAQKEKSTPISNAYEKNAQLIYIESESEPLSKAIERK